MNDVQLLKQCKMLWTIHPDGALMCMGSRRKTQLMLIHKLTGLCVIVANSIPGCSSLYDKRAIHEKLRKDALRDMDSLIRHEIERPRSRSKPLSLYLVNRLPDYKAPRESLNWKVQSAI